MLIHSFNHRKQHYIVDATAGLTGSASVSTGTAVNGSTQLRRAFVDLSTIFFESGIFALTAYRAAASNKFNALCR